MNDEHSDLSDRHTGDLPPSIPPRQLRRRRRITARPIPRVDMSDKNSPPARAYSTNAPDQHRGTNQDIPDPGNSLRSAPSTQLEQAQRRHRKKKPSKTWLALREVLMVFIVAIAISSLIKAFLIQAFIIPSGSMQDTLQINDRVLVSKLVPHPRQLNRGDIIVFEDQDNWLDSMPQTSPGSYIKQILITLGLRPDDSQNHLIKRVIGLPGDHVQCCDSQRRLVVNGVSIDEPYVKSDSSASEIDFDVRVPDHKLWVMGDNRDHSGDSRYHMEEPGKGFVDMSAVTGRAFVIMWPLSRWETLKNTDAFAAVPPHPK